MAFWYPFGEEAAAGMVDIGKGRRIFSAGADPSSLTAHNHDHPLTLFRCNESGWWGVANKIDGML